MSGQASLISRPSLEQAEEAGRVILQEFNPRKIVYLDADGGWKDNPRSLRDRISHALLFQLWRKGEKNSLAILRSAFSTFQEADSWTVAEKIWAAGSRRYPATPPPLVPFLILCESLLWIIQHEALRLNAEAFAPEWDRDGQAAKGRHLKRLDELGGSLESVLNSEERRQFQETSVRLMKENAAVIEPLARDIAEEEKTRETIESLLASAASLGNREDIEAMILDKIQPPMGVITQTPPALLFPCLRLLLESRVDIGSGIPYLASVVLSYFQDPRSTESLLAALEFYPLSATKIRENIIYTLGILREERAVPAIARVLKDPDPSLFEQKEEAIWALGRIGLASLEAVPELVKYADHPSAKLKTYLAWALGEVGRAQKEQSGGVSADIVIALLKLLQEKNKQTFEEAVGSLRKIQLPDFVHSLYLYHAGAISILGLKPAQRGLYELSETLHHLLRKKRTAVMAVNGDSGTGKTYFCQAVAEGVAGLAPHEILYLMRDTKRGQKVFNRLLGLGWLKKHIDPAYYEDYPVSNADDNPEAFFREFLEENADKRLIILDGCRDRHYFQRVIDFFYQQGELDIEVNFRANFSTRRLNLEEREFALESVKLHLAFVEEPALEDTSFYQEGVVILYDLDNSLGSRLNRQETKELLEKRRIDSWGELIRIGDFRSQAGTLGCREENLGLKEEDFVAREEVWPEPPAKSFFPGETKFKPLLNEDLRAEPNLLLTIPLQELDPKKIRFYAQDQVAGCGEKGQVFVLSFLDNRIFKTALEGVSDFALLGRTLYLSVPGRGLLSLSFERNEIAVIDSRAPVAIASSPPDRLITAEEDGTVRVWDCLDRKISSFAGGFDALSSLAVDHSGRIYAGGAAGDLKQWDLDLGIARTFEEAGRAALLRPYPCGKILAAEDGTPPVLRIIDFAGKSLRAIPLPKAGRISGVNVYVDGRIIVGLRDPQAKGGHIPENLLIVYPQQKACSLIALSGHGRGTKDCLSMGPKIVTCGEEADGRASLRVWGSEYYVKTELSKLFIKP